MKFHLSSLYWGESRNLRKRYHKISADKAKTASLDCNSGEPTHKLHNLNLSSISRSLALFCFLSLRMKPLDSLLHDLSMDNSFRIPDLHSYTFPSVEINTQATLRLIDQPHRTLQYLHMALQYG